MKKKPADPTPIPVNRLVKAATNLRNATVDYFRDAPLNIPATIAPAWSEFYDALEAPKAPLVMPKDKTEGLRNFIAMAIKALDEGTPAEAKYLLVDLWNDIGSAYVIK